MNVLENLKCNRSHEQVEEVDGTTVRVELTDFAQHELGDLVFVSLSEVGDTATVKGVFTDVESVEAIFDVYSPITGVASVMNEDILDNSEMTNEALYEAWLIETKGIPGREELMDSIAYEKVCEEKGQGMGEYVPSTSEEQQEVLKAMGVSSSDELYTVVPSDMKVDKLTIPEGRSELEVSGIVRVMAIKGKTYNSIFYGAGTYNRYVPSVVKSVAGKEEFLTVHTPYQAEINRGILQSIFEYQTMIYKLTDTNVSNASVYDGASATVEAMVMCHNCKKEKVAVSGAVNPMTIQTIQTYYEGNDTRAVVVLAKDGETDLKALMGVMGQTTSGMFIQQLSCFGQIEGAAVIDEAVRTAGAKSVMGIYPTAGAAPKSPRECGADVITDESQPLGMSLAFDGPYLEFITCARGIVRQLSGRIVDKTKDVDGRRTYALTFRAKEQHIQREKASFDICSNQILCAMTTAVYMASMGTIGVSQVVFLCCSRAHYATAEISRILGSELVNQGDFFNEFVTKVPYDADVPLRKLDDHDILGGYPVEGDVLWCITEMSFKAQIDALAECLKEVRT